MKSAARLLIGAKNDMVIDFKQAINTIYKNLSEKDKRTGELSRKEIEIFYAVLNILWFWKNGGNNAE